MAVLVAEAEQESLRLYEMDLIWMIVRSKYDGEFPQPSKLVKRGPVKKEKTAQEIIDDLLNGLGGKKIKHGSIDISGTCHT